MWKVITVLAVLLVSAAIHQTYQELRRIPYTVKDAPVGALPSGGVVAVWTRQDAVG